MERMQITSIWTNMGVRFNKFKKFKFQSGFAVPEMGGDLSGGMKPRQRQKPRLH